MDTISKDWFYRSEEFQHYFKNGTRSMLLKANLPHLTILAVSDAFLALVQKERGDLLNRDMLQMFPGNAGDPSEKNSGLLHFQTIIESKKLSERPPFKYEIYKAETGKWETEYWTNSNEPILNEEGEVAYIINTTLNITQQLLTEHIMQDASKLKDYLLREQTLNDELHESQGHLHTLNSELDERVESRTKEIKNSEKRFRSLVEQLPAAINLFLTDDLIVDLPNSRMLEIWGRTFDEVNGKPLGVGMPELLGQPFMQKLRDVISTGIAYYSTEEKAIIQRNGRLDEYYFNIVYQPIVNEDGTITSCLQIASDVTESVFSRRKIQLLNEELATMNEEMALTNEELAAANEELAAASEEQLAANEELLKMQDDLSMRNQQLNESEDWFRNLINQSPVAIALFRGPDFVIELFNKKILEYWSRTAEQVQNLPLFTALPETSGQGFEELLTNVLQTGERLEANELRGKFS